MSILTIAKILAADKWARCVGPGWYPFVARCCLTVLENGGTIAQVKEKFGGLRLYADFPEEPEDSHSQLFLWDVYQNQIKKYIQAAETASYWICEECGTTRNNVTTKGGWLRTLCEPCHKSRYS